MNSLEGQFLIAVPKLRDPGFYHSVVVLIRHNEEGAFGLTLNRPSGTPLEEVWSQISQNHQCHWRQSLFTGGPVPGPLMVLHDDKRAGEMEVIPKLYFTVDPDKLAELFDKPAARAQFYTGYCGWGAGQLEMELQVGSWITVPASARHVFDADAELWKTVTAEITSSAVISALHIKHIPPEADNN